MMMNERNQARSEGSAFWLLVPAMLLLVALFGYPLLKVLITSILDPGFTLAHYLRLLDRPIYLTVLVRTVEVSLIVTVLCFLLGYPAAYYLAHCPPRLRAYLFLLILLPMWTSLLIRSYSWIVVLGKNGVINLGLIQLGLITEPLQMLYTTGTVYLAMVQILLPIMILTCYSVMIKIDPGLVRAARVLGASAWRAFATVYFPLSLAGVSTGAVIVFILAMGFFVTPALVGSRQDIMLGNLIETQINQAVNLGFASALGLLLLAATVAVVMLFRAVMRWRFAHASV
jgi:ABC-type spermidine/putrescine transport system permease subunit I